MRRRADSQSFWATWASLAMSSAPMNARARNSGSGASGTRLAGAVLLPPGLHLRQPRLHLRQRLPRPGPA